MSERHCHGAVHGALRGYYYMHKHLYIHSKTTASAALLCFLLWGGSVDFEHSRHMRSRRFTILQCIALSNAFPPVLALPTPPS